MKINRRTVLSTAAVLGAAALVAGGTIAYFTDTDTARNTFTVGDVDITLYESQLHRQNSGRMGNFPALASDEHYCDWNATVETTAGDSTLISGSYDKAAYCTPNMNEVSREDAISAIGKSMTNAGRNWGYSDETIKTDAQTYQTGYLTDVASDIVPGQNIRKFSYVQNNEEASDAYVMISYKVPKDLNNKLTVNIPSTPFLEDADAEADGVNPYFAVVEKVGDNYEERTMTKAELKAYKGYEEGDFMVYSAVTKKALKPGEMTFWSPVNTIKLNSDTQRSDSTATATYVEPGFIFNIDVEAKAIQARTFGDAVEAINAL